MSCSRTPTPTPPRWARASAADGLRRGATENRRPVVRAIEDARRFAVQPPTGRRFSARRPRSGQKSQRISRATYVRGVLSPVRPLLFGGACLAGTAATWAAFGPRSQVFGRFPHRAVTGETRRQVALTFDDGPNEPWTSQLARHLGRPRGARDVLPGRTVRRAVPRGDAAGGRGGTCAGQPQLQPRVPPLSERPEADRGDQPRASRTGPRRRSRAAALPTAVAVPHPRDPAHHRHLWSHPGVGDLR